MQDDTGLDEVFDYVKIDTEAGLDSAQIDNSYCDDGVIYNGLVEEQDDIQTYAIINGMRVRNWKHLTVFRIKK